MKGYRCKTCGTGYSSIGDDVPPSPEWRDGHVCEMVEVKSRFEGEAISSEELTVLRAKAQKSLLQPCVAHSVYSDEEEAREERMKHIGQNGNDGLHYEREGDDFNG